MKRHDINRIRALMREGYTDEEIGRIEGMRVKGRPIKKQSIHEFIRKWCKKNNHTIIRSRDIIPINHES